MNLARSDLKLCQCHAAATLRENKGPELQIA